jgi:hypothetical protein
MIVATPDEPRGSRLQLRFASSTIRVQARHSFGGHGVRWEAVEDAVTIGATAEVVIVSEHVQLKVGRPLVHDLELPFSFGVVGHTGVDT